MKYALLSLLVILALAGCGVDWFPGVAIAPGAPTITTTALPNATVGTAYSQTLAATGGTAPYIWELSAGTLPAGLSLSTSGTITGTPTTAGNFSFTIKVTDSAATPLSATKDFTISTASATALSLSTTPVLPDGTVGAFYSQDVVASGGTPTYTMTVSAGALPPGILLDSATGLISGTPTSSGTYHATIKVTDSSTTSTPATKDFTFIIFGSGNATLSVTTGAVPGTFVGKAYSKTLTASGGVPPYTWSVSAGALPAGLALAPTTGVISGTATTTETATFTATATDSAGTPATSSKDFTITVGPALAITTTSLPAGVIGTAYSQTLSASGGVAPYRYSLSSGTLPAGLSLSSDGVISGKPTTKITASFTVAVTDSDSPATSATKALSIAVSTGFVPL